METRKRYTEEFKVEAVNLVKESGLSIGQVASDLGIGLSTLNKWLQIHRRKESDSNALSENELIELKRLRKENRILRLERDLLKKTALYFAKDTGNGVGL